jgi:hypothetical protein
VEILVNGKHRDFCAHERYHFTEVEAKTSLESTPARAAIVKKVAGDKVGMVETMTRGGATFYEAAYRRFDRCLHVA